MLKVILSMRKDVEKIPSPQPSPWGEGWGEG